jgi:hypothetical protein
MENISRDSRVFTVSVSARFPLETFSASDIAYEIVVKVNCMITQTDMENKVYKVDRY